jgi:hypothetical protein
MMSFMGKATIAAGVIPARAIEMFEEERKYREVCVPQINVPIKTRRRNTSQRASKPSNHIHDRWKAVMEDYRVEIEEA